ncbi:MAG: transposase [Flavobacterium sp.]|nr:transposase [Flavobacterium sp.]
MKQERKIYDSAFKRKAVELSNERSNITELSRELVIRVTMLYKWRKDYDKFGVGSFPGKGILRQTPEQKTINELEAKLKEVDLEVDILKKSSVEVIIKIIR